MELIINQRFISSAKNNQLDELKKILNQGADIHAEFDGALRAAVRFGHLEIVKFLLVPEVGSMAIEHGANVHANGDEALRWSTQRGHHDVCKVLSSFIQEEKLLVAASESMPLVAASVSNGSMLPEISSGESVSEPPRPTRKKSLRQKI